MPKIGKNNKVIYLKKDIQFIYDNWTKMTNGQLAEALGVQLTNLRTKLYELGLKKIEMEYWTQEQIEFLIENYKEIGDTELAQLFEDEWPKNKRWTKKHIEKKRRYLKLKRTKSQLKKVRKRNTELGMYAVCNKKRWEATGSNPIGTIVVWKHTNSGGYIAHIKTENGYVHYNRWLWEQHNGTIPEGFNIVRKNTTVIVPKLEDLEMISKADHAKRNKAKFDNLPEDLKEIIKINNKITKIIKENDNNN